MVKVCLISVDGNNNVFALRYLSSALKKAGHAVRLISMPADIDYDADNIFRYDFLLDQLYNDEIIDQLRNKAKDYDLIGISSIAASKKRAIQVIKELESLKIPIIWGGKYATTNPDQCIKHSDMICVGDGEEAIVELADSLDKKGSVDHNTKNVWFKTDDMIIRNPIRYSSDFNNMRLDYSFEEQYTIEKNKLVPMTEKHLQSQLLYQTMRGCPFRCTYCTNRFFLDLYDGRGNHFALKDVELVIDELSDFFRKNKAITSIWFVDDDFFLRSLDDIKIFSELYKEKINIPFKVYGSANSITDEKLRLLINAGLRLIDIGIQSGSERINKEVYDRKFSTKKNIEMFNLLYGYLKKKRLDKAGLQFISNNPYETEEDIKETLKLINKVPAFFDIYVYNLILFPGTYLYEKAIKDGLVDQDIENSELNYVDTRIFPIRKTNEYYDKLLQCFWGKTTYFWKGSVPNIFLHLLTYGSPNKFKKSLISLLYQFQFYWSHPTLQVELSKVINDKNLVGDKDVF